MPSEYVKNVCSRVLAGKVGVTYEDWNALVDTVVCRMYANGTGASSVRRACEILGRGSIRAFNLERMPVSCSVLDFYEIWLNESKLKHCAVSIEKIKLMVSSATENAISQFIYQPYIKKNGQASKHRFEYVKNPYYAKFTALYLCGKCGKYGAYHRSIFKWPHGLVCIGCLSRIRKEERLQQKAIDGLSALSNELKEFKRELKELKNGIK